MARAGEGVETPRSDCKDAPRGRSRLTVKHDALNGSHERLQWSWSGGAATTVAELGDPSASTRYDFCSWDGRAGVPTLVSSIAIPSGSRWKTSAAGARYIDKRGLIKGLARTKLRSGIDGKAAMSLQAKGFLVAVPPPASATTRFAADPNVIVQLVASTGACWTSTFGAADFRTNAIAKTSAAHAGP